MKNNSPDRVRKTFAKIVLDFIISFWKTITWTFIILILSFLPGNAFEKMNLPDIGFQDLVVHFIMYFFLTFLFITELSHKISIAKNTNLRWIIPLLAAFILGVITESVQWLWIAGRNGDIIDFLLNMTGATIAFVIFRKIK
jgi:hypothetical protein